MLQTSIVPVLGLDAERVTGNGGKCAEQLFIHVQDCLVCGVFVGLAQAFVHHLVQLHCEWRVYSEYSLLLAGDVSGFGHEGGNFDKAHAVVKCLGLAQIPLVCVMTKYLKEAYKYQTYENQPQAWLLVVRAVLIWLLLLVTKLSLASFLERISIGAYGLVGGSYQLLQYIRKKGGVQHQSLGHL